MLDRKTAQAYIAEEVLHEGFDIGNRAKGLGPRSPVTEGEGAKADPMGGILGPEGEQVAGIGGVTRGILRHSTKSMIEKQRENIAAPPSVDPEEGKRILDALADDVPLEKRTPERNINIERHHEGAPAARLEWEPEEMLRIAENSDDIAKVLDYTAARMEQQGKVRFDEIRAGTATHNQILKEFEPILQGQKGLWSARQLFAARRILATVGTELAEMGRQIQHGDRTPETLLRFEQKSAAFMAIHDGLRQNVRGVAQALAQQRMIAETLDSGNVSRIAEVMAVEGGHTHDTHKRAALMLKALEEGDPDDINTVVNAVKGNKWRRGMDLAVQYWQASILSGPTTHIVNLTGNTAVALWEAAMVRPLAAAIGSVRSRVTGNMDRVTGEEAIANIAAGWAGTRDGVAMAYEVLKGKQGQFRGSRVDFRSPDEMGELEKAGRWVGERLAGGAPGSRRRELGATVGEYTAALPFKMLSAGDEIFKTLAYRQELTSLVVRDAMKKGLKGDAMNAYINNLLQDPPAEFYDQAMRRAREMTFQERDLGGVIGSLAQKTRGLVEEWPMLKFFAPFITTPSNLLKYAMETSALAVVSPRLIGMIRKGGADADIALAKVSLGMMVTFAAYHAHQNGVITGNGPEDWRMRDAMMHPDIGWRPNAIRIGDEYYTYNRMDPFGASLSAVADFLDKAQYADREATMRETLMQLPWAIAEHTVDATYMKGVNDFLKAIDGSDKQRESFLAQYGAALVPYSSAQRSIARWEDDYQRARYNDRYTSGLMHMTWQRVAAATPDFVPVLPGVSDLPKARHWDGSFKIPNPGFAAWQMSPIKYGKAGEGDAANEALIANGIVPKPPPSQGSLGGVGFSFLALDRGRGFIYDAFFEKVGQKRREYVEEVVNEEWFREMEAGPHSAQYHELESALGRAMSDARDEFIHEDLKRLIMQDPDAVSQVAEMFGRDPETVVDALKARVDAGFELSEEEQKLFTVKGRATRPGLPVPRLREGAQLRF